MQTSIPSWRQLNWGHHCRNPQLGSQGSMPPLPLGAGFAGGGGKWELASYWYRARAFWIGCRRCGYCAVFSWCGSGWSAVIRGIFGTGSGFRVGEGGRGGLRGGFNFCFQEFLARVYKIFIFALGLGTGLSFYGVWRLSWCFLISWDLSLRSFGNS